MSILGDDLTAAIAAAQAAAHDEDGRWRGVASETPGLGWEVPLPPPPSSAGGFGVLPVTGEGYEVTPPPAPRQVKADLGQLVFGVQPSYSGPEVSGQHYSYGPQVPREITDLGDGRIMVEQRAAGAGPVLISPPPPGRRCGSGWPGNCEPRHTTTGKHCGGQSAAFPSTAATAPGPKPSKTCIGEPRVTAPSSAQPDLLARSVTNSART